MKPKIRFFSGGVSTPQGFRSAGVSCGIKKNGDPDLALLVSESDCASAGTFTTNSAKAAPVLYCLEKIRKPVRGVVLNSGNANAATGKPGFSNTVKMAQAASQALASSLPSKSRSEFLICSTGRIGIQLPMAKVIQGIQKASSVLTRKDHQTAKAIMTSDTFPKQKAVSIQFGKHTISIGGMAKGAGMIEPKMSPAGKPPELHATMLCVLTTDVKISPILLQKCLNTAVGQSFNRITVDGDTSTNDTVLLLANGKSSHPPLRENSPALRHFQQCLNEIAKSLALMIVQDGEGITRVIHLKVQGAASSRDADHAVRTIGNSTLAKCAWFGGDPNWGRLLAAIGYSGVRFRQDRFKVTYNDIPLVEKGLQIEKNVKKARKIARKASFMLTCDLGIGKYQSMLYTTDLTEEYVNFNKGE